MANPFYEPGEKRAQKVRELFARIAPRYDLINDLQSAGLHRLWKKRLVTFAQLRPGESALDVCCGTGDLTVRLQHDGVNVVGLDFTEAMLARAARRGALHLVQGDAQSLPFADRTFDVVTIGYGLRNLSSWEGGLQEMWRVAKTGARVLALDFGKPDNRFWRAVYFSYLRALVPIFGKVFCGSAQAYAYILESLQHYPAQRGVAEKLQQLGCNACRTINFAGGAMAINYAIKA
jgi:demethylmenaquinone methyltransferase/2-methoxy-6-polyprenyl-1,4-benzoquinol methylase